MAEGEALTTGDLVAALAGSAPPAAPLTAALEGEASAET